MTLRGLAATASSVLVTLFGLVLITFLIGRVMPIDPVIALTYAGLLEGAVVTETVFSWPGLGQYLTVSLLSADMNAVLGATLVIGLSYLVINLLADLLYRLLDPRAQ